MTLPLMMRLVGALQPLSCAVTYPLSSNAKAPGSTGGSVTRAGVRLCGCVFGLADGVAGDRRERSARGADESCTPSGALVAGSRVRVATLARRRAQDEQAEVAGA